MPMATKLDRVVTYREGLQSIKSNDHLITWSCGINSNTRVAKATKLCWMVTCINGLLLIKSHDCFITWSCKITCQFKTIISPLPQCIGHQTW